MKLSAAARFFDQLPVYDAYTGRVAFMGQFDLFDDSKRDAVSVMRRTLSAAPNVTLPSRLVIKAADQYWLVGQNVNPDTFRSDVIRVKYTIQMSQGLAWVRTPGEVIGNAGGSSAYGSLAWMKDWKEVEFNSRAFPYYELYFALNETISADQYIELAGKIFRSRAVYKSEAGFTVAESDDLGSARVSISYRGPNTYVPATDTYTYSTATVPALQLRYATDFEYEQPSALKREAGDIVLLVRKSDVAGPKVGDTLTLSGRTYNVISISSESDCWNLTGRP